MKLKILTKALLFVLMALSVTFPFCAARGKELVYTQGQFTDVSDSDWYASDVKNAYELGFMNGTSETLFSPDATVSVAQGIAMASRINALQFGKNPPENSKSGNWYDSYVDYARVNGIIDEYTFEDYTRPIKRSEMACLIYNSTDRGNLEKKNNVLYIPDIPNNAPYANKLLILYNAGIIMGSDETGRFYPDNNIKRSECAAIVNRVALPEMRLSKELVVKSSRDAYIISEDEIVNGMRNGAQSGWVYDNRGGAPRYSATEGNYLAITDVSTEYGTAMIREFNQITLGTVVTEAMYTVSGDGIFFEFRDVLGNTAYQLRLVDGNWCVLTEDGKYVSVCENALDINSSAKFALKLVIDLDNGKSTTYINDKNCGTHKLISDNILNYRYAIDEAGTGTVSTDYFCMRANYKAFESFTHFAPLEVYGWSTEGNAQKIGNELVLDKNSAAVKSFDKAKGNIAAQTYFVLPEGGGFEYFLRDGEEEVVSVCAKDSKLYADNKELYTLKPNMWYRLRIDYNTQSSKAEVFLNGRSVGEFFAKVCSGIDAFGVKTAENSAKFDYMRLFEVQTYDDYVPEPTAKASFDDYIVGLNVCSLWKNGVHRGWACITPYDEPRPVLGYYDEGVPESADWEIKFMTEHGIDFQSFCWYNNAQEGTPIKDPRMAEHLHEGYMYAKYSDYMKYNLIWEASNATKFGSKMFREQVIPYWFENYFLDDRYLKIDNKIVLCIFGADKLYTHEYFGSISGAKAEFDYLDEVAKSYGFDGMIIMANSSDTDSMAKIGVDGRYSYGWGSVGKTYEANVSGMLSTVNDKNIKTIPTVSVGFDSIPWHGLRYGNMTVNDYRKTHSWVKEEFLPKYSSGNDWNDRFVMLSTWNEYGEGTYIMPAGLNGFGYLDVVREMYTDLPDIHNDVVPTYEQAQRINHLYAQYASLLRHDGWFEEPEFDENDFDSIFTYEFTRATTSHIHLDESRVVFDENGISSVSTNESSDPIVVMNTDANVNVDGVTHMKATLKVPKNTRVEVFFTTENAPQWTADKSFSFVADSDELKTYTFKFANAAFNGKLLKIRIDPVSAKNLPFTVKSFELLKLKPQEAACVFVNNIQFKSDIEPDVLGNKILYPFDPATGIHYALNVHHNWDKRQGILTIEGNQRNAVFTVGDGEYVSDGKKKSLGYALYLKNGLPMLDFEVLCQVLGYECSIKGKSIFVKTKQYGLYSGIQDRVPGVWEFNDFDTEGWQSTHMSLVVSGGTMKMSTISDTLYDPIMRFERPVQLNASYYSKLQVRVRYKYQNKKNTTDHISVYFITDKKQSWDEHKSLKLSLPSVDSGEEWVELEYDLKTNAEWKNFVTGLRFDPFNAVGYMEIDYIKFVK